MKKLTRKLVLCLLSALLSVSVISFTGLKAAADDTDFTDDPIVSVTPLKAEEVESAADKEKGDLIDLTGSEMVTVIVELTQPSILEKGLQPGSKAAKTYAKTLKTEQKKISNTIKSQSLTLAEAMIEKEMAADSLAESIRQTSLKYSYVNVMNGFAMDVPYSMLPIIKKMSGVKSVFVSRTYNVPETEIGTDMYTSTEMISSAMMNAYGYDGTGTLVGVLDTGIDVTHEAFANDPEEPKITAQIESDALNAQGETFVSLKIPFAYDYADGDADVYPRGSNHGNHVSGTVAGYALQEVEDGVAVKFSGVAPQAQLAMFKVFSDNGGGARDAWILSALEDVAIVGCDVINMSLGSPAGFSSEIYSGEETMSDVYTRLYDFGVVLSISAGNEYYYSMETPGGYGYPYAENIDYGLVGSPSSYTAPTSIASIENTNIITDYFSVDGNIIMYSDTAESPEQLFYNALKDLAPIEFVLVPGYGEESDYEGLDVEGKIAVVSRGSTTFISKQTTAAAMGAVAIIIYNNQAGTISMQIQPNTIPAIAITADDAEFLLGSETKVVEEVGKDHSFENPAAWEMSDFSSWGVTPDLKLKPEVTAPGGHIYSTLPGNTYGDASGTSMAAPHYAGAAAIAKQWVDALYEDYATDLQKADYVNALLMSTATPVPFDAHYDENDELVIDSFWSPRKQGAGLIDVAYTAMSYAFLTVNGNVGNRPKADLGDDPAKTGKYTIVTNINNWSIFTLHYTPKLYVQTDMAFPYGDVTLDTLMPYALEPQIEGLEEIYVNEGASKRVKVTFTLSEADREYLDTYFPNGAYVEGYLVFEADGEEMEAYGQTDYNMVDLSLPFLAFYGDWNDAPVMDSQEEPEFVLGGSWSWESYYYWYQYTGVLPFIGQNIYDPDNSGFVELPQHKTFSSDSAYRFVVDYYGPQYAQSYLWQDDEKHVGILAITLPLLRSVNWFNTTITDANTGEKYFEAEYDYNISKNYDGDPLTSFAELDWGGYNAFDGQASALPEGTVVNVVTKVALNENSEIETFTEQFTVDNTAPALAGYDVVDTPVSLAETESGKKILIFYASDNYYLAAAELINRNQIVDGEYFYDEEPGTLHQIMFDVTDLGNASTYTVRLADYTGYEKTVRLSADTTLTLRPARTTVNAGSTITYSVTDINGLALANDSLTWTVEGQTSEGTTITDGVLTVAEDEMGRTLTVTATYGETEYTGTATVTVNRLFPVTLTVNGEGTVTADVEDLTAVLEGSRITFTAAPAGNNHIGTITVNGETVTADADGKFTVTIAGATEIVVNFTDIAVASIFGASITLNDSFNVNFYLDILDADALENVFAKLTFNGVDTLVKLGDLPTNRIQGKTYRKLTQPVFAKQMRDTITLQLVDGEGNIVMLYDIQGADVSQGYEYSVVTYLDKARAQDDELLTALANAVDNYGMWAQKQLNYKADEVTPDASALDGITVDNLAEYEQVKNGEIAGVKDTASLQLKDTIHLKFSFQITSEDVALEDLKVVLDGQEIIPAVDGNKYSVFVRNIKPLDFGTAHVYELTNTKTGETLVKTFSPFSYCYLAMTSTTNETLINVCKALYNFYLTAEAYFVLN